MTQKQKFARLLCEAHNVAWGRGLQYYGLVVGLCDAVDSDGKPYQSQWCMDVLREASVLCGIEIHDHRKEHA